MGDKSLEFKNNFIVKHYCFFLLFDAFKFIILY